MFSAVVAFREGTFHEINNADWISNADLWWPFVVRLNKLLNKQSIVELLVIWDAMPLTYRQFNDRGPGIIGEDRLKSMAIQLLAQQLIQVNDKEILKVCITRYVWGAEQYSIM